ncbi:methyltransferase domain-containing protein [Talaromyces proteolyticus]|uniref:Methyltransferase domain-containing protein n=1 Tax=Talaromyces proteolyticus TaxID=1131652 RepID=A0AAD4KMK1_9EURO|nr:methyltransferase domain-containing protein [Talaromyces proteolyticus]KAH8695370.1 methyltransferase domain-containing protein [Talaromyces proteolyticus]
MPPTSGDRATEVASHLQRTRPGTKPKVIRPKKTATPRPPPATRGPSKGSSPFKTVPVKPTVSHHGVSPRVLTMFGVGMLGIGMYCGYLYSSYRQAVIQSKTMEVPDDVSDRYNTTATYYDDEVDLGERFMQLGAKRKELVRMARGDVLEVSCGTGRNMGYYQLGEKRGLDAQGHSEIQGCRSVTFVDLSPQMVEVAKRKFQQQYPGFERAAFWTEDARKYLPSKKQLSSQSQSARSQSSERAEWSYSRPYFDTVLETMGLCSTPDPVGLLRHLGSITEPEKGRILLLEHGRSRYDWVNNILDNLAPAHAHRHGCWWNRDIGQIVEQSGLEVVEIKRYHLGTTWRVILRPKPGPRSGLEQAAPEKQPQGGEEKSRSFLGFSV